MATKNPGWKGPLALALTLTVLSTAVYWLEFRKKPDGEKAKEREKKVFSLNDIQTAEITMIQGASLIRLGCLDLAAKLCVAGANSKWELRAPGRLGADDGNVQSLLSSLNNLLPTDSVDLSAETAEKRRTLLAQYGLSDEQRKSAQRVDLVDEAGNQRGLVLGDLHPMGGSRYALVEVGPKDRAVAQDSKVYLVPASFPEAISKPLTHWRNKKILTVQANRVSRIVFESAQGSFEAKKKDGSWTIEGRQGQTRQAALPGDIENIDNWISAVTYLSAREFASEQKSSAQARTALAGAKSVLRLTLDQGDGRPVTLELFEKKTKSLEKLFATASNLDPLFELEGTARQRVEKSITDLRLARLLGSMDRFNAREVSFSSKSLGASPVVFLRREGKWARQGAPAPAATSTPVPARQDDDTKITSLLDRLSGNRVKAFLPERRPGRDALEISLKDEHSQLLRRLEFWKEGDRLLARDLLSKRGESLELDSSLSQTLPWEKL